MLANILIVSLNFDDTIKIPSSVPCSNQHPLRIDRTTLAGVQPVPDWVPEVKPIGLDEWVMLQWRAKFTRPWLVLLDHGTLRQIQVPTQVQVYTRWQQFSGQLYLNCVCLDLARGAGLLDRLHGWLGSEYTLSKHLRLRLSYVLATKSCPLSKKSALSNLGKSPYFTSPSSVGSASSLISGEGSAIDSRISPSPPWQVEEQQRGEPIRDPVQHVRGWTWRHDRDILSQQELKDPEMQTHSPALVNLRPSPGS